MSLGACRAEGEMGRESGSLEEPEISGLVQKPENVPEGDFANYLCTYGYLYHQKDMLEDHRRMQCYYDAIFTNKECFANKAVLDVGAGSGVLALWAVQAGARIAYAVEATYIAQQAKRLAKHHGVGDRVDVRQCYLEEVDLPENVDIILSEFMGYFLLRESMFDTILHARDKYLKEGGAIFPSHCRMFIAPMHTQAADNKVKEFHDSVDGWQSFVQTTRSTYGIDMSCLTEDYEKEQRGYFLQTAAWIETSPSQLLGPAYVIKQIDLHTASLESVQGVNSSFRFRLRGGGSEGALVNAFCGWFDVHFNGSADCPVNTTIELSTAPEYGHCTHWGQQALFVEPPIEGRDGEELEGRITIVKHKENRRLLDIGMVVSHKSPEQVGEHNHQQHSSSSDKAGDSGGSEKSADGAPRHHQHHLYFPANGDDGLKQQQGVVDQRSFAWHVD
jgi:protein arginine N-methyltransferase 1